MKQFYPLVRLIYIRTYPRVSMLKKISVFFIFLIIIILLGFTYSIFTKSYVTLTENKTISKSLDDFILHVRVNDNKDGVEVMHSIQYTGEDSVEIQHQTPLVSVSMRSEERRVG